ncbi:MAG: nucleotidyl transferase AbiEii/AbiGii toxin family protein [Ignavibacteriae bacterium]|nr:nucleotidyl transferase AbiEii/AbiGii toxin family protein [Ignavibacteriota bacterium]
MAVANRPKTIMWHEEILSRNTLRALTYIGEQQWFRRSTWYLAGGTALALQVGHRTSIDLDFFIPQSTFSTAKFMNLLPTKVWQTNILREGTLYGKLYGTKTSFIAYPFFVPQYPFLNYKNLRILDAHDIAVMKITAISQRGKKRDFVDLYWCCTNLLPLDDALKRIPSQYLNGTAGLHHILKSLTYFADAEDDPMPTLFFRATWKEIKTFFQREIPRVAKELLELR